VVNEDRKVPKCGYHDRILLLDQFSTDYYQQMHFDEECLVGLKGQLYLASEKKLKKMITQYIEPLTNWLSLPENLDLYNRRTFEEVKKVYADGTIPKWEMESLCYYYTAHELDGIDAQKYGVRNWSELPEKPVVYDTYVRWLGKEKHFIPKYEIVRIAGTVIGSDNTKHRVYLLTPDAVVTVKMNQGMYTYYQRQLSAIDPDSGTKTVTDQSWFKRGTLLMVCGYRDGAIFKAYRYNDTVYPHTVARINNITSDKELELQTTRGIDENDG
jgi:DNA polymerase-3 subunit alpha